MIAICVYLGTFIQKLNLLGMRDLAVLCSKLIIIWRFRRLGMGSEKFTDKYKTVKKIDVGKMIAGKKIVIQEAGTERNWR